MELEGLSGMVGQQWTLSLAFTQGSIPHPLVCSKGSFRGFKKISCLLLDQLVLFYGGIHGIDTWSFLAPNVLILQNSLSRYANTDNHQNCNNRSILLQYVDYVDLDSPFCFSLARRAWNSFYIAESIGD